MRATDNRYMNAWQQYVHDKHGNTSRALARTGADAINQAAGCLGCRSAQITVPVLPDWL